MNTDIDIKVVVEPVKVILHTDDEFYINMAQLVDFLRPVAEAYQERGDVPLEADAEPKEFLGALLSRGAGHMAKQLIASLEQAVVAAQQQLG